MLSGKQLAILLSSLAAIAGLTFAIGFVTGTVKDSNQETATGEDTGGEDSPAIAGVTPKRLDAEAIIKERQIEKEAVAPEQFTFLKTLSKDQPKPGDFAPRSPEPAAKPVEAEPVKPAVESKTGSAKSAPAVQAKPVAPMEEKKQEKPKAEVKPVAEKAAQKSAVAPQKPENEKPAPDAVQPGKPGVKAWTVQVGAFATKPEAEKLAARLKAKQHMTNIQPFSKNGATWYRVRVGSYKTESAARRAAEQMKNDEKVSAFITAY